LAAEVGRHAITVVFAATAAAIAAETASAITAAVAQGGLGDWLVAGYGLLKLTVALAFTAFVVMRAPARRRAREPIAYLACAAAILPAALQAPTESAAPELVLAGELVALLGCAWMLVAALALGRCFGVLPEARGLVTHGPYQLVRHPLYLGEFAAMGGLLIASPSGRNLALRADLARAARRWRSTPRYSA
jgi:protein-S-isoprenylcysteine O-methyltransferase Ste14